MTLKCRYCGSDRHVHEIVLPDWGRICDVCHAKKDLQRTEEAMMVAKTRYNEALARLEKVRHADAAETSERTPSRENVRCIP